MVRAGGSDPTCWNRHEGGSDGFWLAWFPGLRGIAEQRISLLQELAGPRGTLEELSVQVPLGQDEKKNTDTRDRINAGRKSS